MHEHYLQALYRLFPVLCAAPPTIQARISSCGLILNADAKEMLLDSGDTPPGVLFVLSGSARIIHTGEGGKEIAMERVGVGEICSLGLTSILSQCNAPASCRAQSACAGVVVPGPIVMELLTQCPEFVQFSLAQVSRRLQESYRQMHALAFQKLDARIAALLVASDNDVITTTHQRLANELGCVREIVSRVLKSFEHAGLLRLERAQIILLQREKLAQIA